MIRPRVRPALHQRGKSHFLVTVLATIALASLAPGLAFADVGLGRALDGPDEAAAHPYGAESWQPGPAPSPAIDRVLLALAGSSLGLVASVMGGALLSPTLMLHGYLGVYLVIVAVPVTALLTIPAGVFLFGNLGGRGADFGWTLLGSLLGALPGATLIAIGFPVNEATRIDPGWFFAGGGVVAGLGAIAGSILAFELSSQPGEVMVGAGPGGLLVRGEFE